MILSLVFSISSLGVPFMVGVHPGKAPGLQGSELRIPAPEQLAQPIGRGPRQP
jgi:hypothetical protein